MALEIEDGELKAVQYNSCKRGIDYAKQEFYDPRRMVTTTAAVSGGVIKRVPVRTSEPLPIAHIPALLEAIHNLRLQAPLSTGEPVMTNFSGTGVDVVTTRNLQQVT